jgi:hypothetical protein
VGCRDATNLHVRLIERVSTLVLWQLAVAVVACTQPAASDSAIVADANHGNPDLREAGLDCVPSWKPIDECSCVPTPCAGCSGTLDESDGCGHSRQVVCHPPALCDRPCCAGTCCPPAQRCDPVVDRCVSPRLKGCHFNPLNDLGGAWENWFHDNPTVRTQVLSELDALRTKTGVNFIYLMPSAGRIGWPASELQTARGVRTLASYADFVNEAWTRGVRVGLSLNTHCIVSNAYAESRNSPHIGGTSEWWPRCSEDNVAESVSWYSAVIASIEAQVTDTQGIAFWEMSGNPAWGAAELPMWSCSGIEAGVQAFVSAVWPAFTQMTGRPKAVTAVVPIPGQACAGYTALSNFLVWTAGQPRPDYLLLASSPLIDVPTVLQIVGAQSSGRIMLGDFKWSPSDPFNPAGMPQLDVAQQQIGFVHTHGLGGWWFWAYRDGAGLAGIRDSSSTGLGGWKDDVAAVIATDTALP